MEHDDQHTTEPQEELIRQLKSDLADPGASREFRDGFGFDFYRMAFEVSSLAIFVHAVVRGYPGPFIDLNPAACRLLGYERDELIGLTPWQVDADPDTPPAEYAEVNGGQPFPRIERDLLTKDGHRVSVQIDVQKFEYEGRELAISFVLDLTDRKRAEGERDARERQLRAIYNNALAGILTTDTTGRLVDVNQRWVEMSGYSVDELLGMHVAELTHPDDIPLSKNQFDLIVRGNLDQYSIVKRFIRKDRTEFWGEVHVTPITDQHGRVVKTIGLVTDITVRRLVEEELERERNLFITGPIVVFKWATTAGWPMEYVSPNIEEVFGYHPGEFITGGLTAGDLLHPDDVSRLVVELDELDQSGGVHLEQEYRIRDKQGRWRWVHDMTIAIRDNTGHITHFLGYALDITGRKKAEDALQQAQDLFITGPTVVFRWRADSGWPVEYVSANVTEQFGYTVDELTGGAIPFAGLVHPEDLKRITDEVTGHSESGRHHFEQEYRIRDKAGNWRWVYDLTLIIRGEDGEVSHFHGYVIDISERKASEQALRESEERFQLVLAGADLGTWDWDVTTGRITINRRWMDMLGYGHRELEHTYETWLGLLHPEDKGQTVELLNRHLEGASDFYEMEFRMRHKAGHWVWVQTRGKVTARRSDGRPVRMAGTHLDITERKNLEHQLRQAQKLEAIGTLAGGIAHDFNNILLSILGNAELAEDLIPPGGPARDHLSEINIASRRAAELVKQLLAFARPSTQHRRPVCISHVLDEVQSIVRATLPANIEIQRHCSSPDSHTISEPTELHQIFLNLCTNAGQAMLEYGGRLVIIQEEADYSRSAPAQLPDLAPGRYARVTISDTGAGMTPDVRERIFEPFFTTREIGKGSGMGLAVVHGLVHSLKGGITVASKLKEGSEFTVYLPLTETPMVIEQESDTAVPQGTEHILLVDDEPQLVRIFTRLLTKLGYRVTAYSDSRLTLDVFRANPRDFDIVLTDQTMPGMSGAELAREVRLIRPELPVILITGYSETMPEQKAIELGVAAYVMKPLDRKALGETIRRVLDGQGGE